MFARTAVLGAACLVAGSILSGPVLSGAALAQGRSRPVVNEQDKLQAACSGDYIRLCNGADPAGKEVEACFERNMSQMSPGCRTAINEYKQRNPGGGRPKG